MCATIGDFFSGVKRKNTQKGKKETLKKERRKHSWEALGQQPSVELSYCLEIHTSTIVGQKARGPWAGPKHDNLTRHEHEPSTIISGLGRHEHDDGLCWLQS
jgi:hypothetical protein